jgi:hypothetical protein
MQAFNPPESCPRAGSSAPREKGFNPGKWVDMKAGIFYTSPTGQAGSIGPLIRKP